MKQVARVAMEALGSAIGCNTQRAYGWYKSSFLGDERGEVGSDIAIPPADGAQGDGSSANEPQDSGWELTSPPEGEQPPASKPPVEEAPPEGSPPEEGQPAPEGEQKPGEGEQPPIELEERLADIEGQMTNMQTDLDFQTKRADFFEAQYNEAVGREVKPTTETPPQEQARGAEGQLPPAIIEPGEWTNQEQTADYIDHVATGHVQKVYEEAIRPAFDSVSKVLTALQETVVKVQYPDYEGIKKDVWGDIYTLDPSGQIIGIKNQALLNFFNAQPNPFEAMYQHGLRKKAPEKIKEGVQKATAQTLKKVMAKPTGPTKIKGGGTGVEDAELGWDETPERRDEILHKRGII